MPYPLRRPALEFLLILKCEVVEFGYSIRWVDDIALYYSVYTCFYVFGTFPPPHRIQCLCVRVAVCLQGFCCTFLHPVSIIWLGVLLPLYFLSHLFFPPYCYTHTACGVSWHPVYYNLRLVQRIRTQSMLLINHIPSCTPCSVGR